MPALSPGEWLLQRVIFAFCALLYSSSALAEAEFTKTQISKLVQPVALYPDPLLQQLLPASTFPDQIADASLLIRGKEDAELIRDQEWDPSVKVIATYPGVLKMMYEKLDWTTDLGNAFLNQHEEVLNEIQGLRSKAKAKGNLNNTAGQTVKTEESAGNTYITIEPSDPEVVYVPQETSGAVYTEHVDSTANVLVPAATFGLGMALGAAMNDDEEHYYYGGPWSGGGGYYNDEWADVRRARNEDVHDAAMKRQEFRQEQRAGRQDYGQSWAKENPDQINKQNANKARQDFQAKQTERRQNPGVTQKQRQQAQRQQGQRQQAMQQNNPQRQQQLADARASMGSRGFGGHPSSSSWSGDGGAAYANRASSRGSSSRSAGGFNRGGGARAGGGSMRAGGGGMRGGGGGRR